MYRFSFTQTKVTAVKKNTFAKSKSCAYRSYLGPCRVPTVATLVLVVCLPQLPWSLPLSFSGGNLMRRGPALRRSFASCRISPL